MIFDSHTHYDDEAFNNDRDEVIQKIQDNDVKKILNCSSCIESSIKTIELTQSYDFIYGAVGVHPESAKEALQNINKIGDMLCNKKIKAVGEIGLDYYYDGDRDIQLKAFREQMDLANLLNYPVVIHDREAHFDTIKIIKEFKNVIGVLHCYSGSQQFAEEVLKCGYYFGFTGVVTFKNAKKTIETLEILPKDRILVETDCPYMAPVPKRGERCDSSYLNYTILKIAQILQMDYESVSKMTYDNACKLFNIK